MYKSNTEFMGVFGFSAAEKLIKDMQIQLKHSPYVKMLHDPVQPMQRNVRLLNNMHKEYLMLINKGFQPPKYAFLSDDKTIGKWTKDSYLMASEIAKIMSIPKLVVLKFFRSLWNLSRLGKIPIKLYDPIGTKEKEKLKDVLINPAKKKMETYAKIGIAIAGIGVIASLVSNLKR